MLNPTMNNTKWDELRLAMYALKPAPSWSTMSTRGYRSPPDREWFYHFKDGGYDTISYVDILVESESQRELVLAALQKVHVPGEALPDGFRVFGYTEDGQAVMYL